MRFQLSFLADLAVFICACLSVFTELVLKTEFPLFLEEPTFQD